MMTQQTTSKLLIMSKYYRIVSDKIQKITNLILCNIIDTTTQRIFSEMSKFFIKYIQLSVSLAILSMTITRSKYLVLIKSLSIK